MGRRIVLPLFAFGRNQEHHPPVGPCLLSLSLFSHSIPFVRSAEAFALLGSSGLLCGNMGTQSFATADYSSELDCNSPPPFCAAPDLSIARLPAPPPPRLPTGLGILQMGRRHCFPSVFPLSPPPFRLDPPGQVFLEMAPLGPRRLRDALSSRDRNQGAPDTEVDYSSGLADSRMLGARHVGICHWLLRFLGDV